VKEHKYHAYNLSDLPIMSAETICDNLDCKHNSRTIENNTKGYCNVPDLIIEGCRCKSYEADFGYMRYTLRIYLSGDIRMPKKLSGSKEWVET